MPDLSTNGDGNGRPKFAPGKKASKALATGHREAVAVREAVGGPAVPFEPRCRVCTSPHRKFIDSLLAKGTHSYVWISENVPGKDDTKIDRRSVSTHAKKHLGYQDAAIRAILEHEADLAAQNYEEGVHGAITHRAVLEIAIRKAHEDIVNGVTSVEPRDLIAMVTALQKMDEQANDVALSTLRMQVQAFIEAIKAETDPETWSRIFTRFQRTMSEEGMSAGELESGPVVDAQVVG